MFQSFQNKTRKSPGELRAIRASVEKVGRLSDGLFKLGPFSIGLDGVLTWVPVVGEVYSAVAGGYIVLQGVRAGVSLPVLASAAALVASRTVISSVPLAGDALADVYTAHKWAARLIVKAIDRKLGATAEPMADPVWRGRQSFA